MSHVVIARPELDVAYPATLGAVDERDRQWLAAAIELSRRCPRSDRAFAVGAILVDHDGMEIARGYSRETDPRDHAEEVALGRVSARPAAVLYTSLEPCSTRASRPHSCTDLILAAGVPRVVLAWREPELFVQGEGVEKLRGAGVNVDEVSDLAARARAVNAHLWE